MPQDTLKSRVSKEAAHFSEIYEYFKNRLERTQKRIAASEPDGEMLPEWLYLFEMPFRDGEMSLPDNGADVPYKAVVETIRALGLHRMRTGALDANDLRTLRADDIEIEDLAAQYKLTNAEQLKQGFKLITRDLSDYDDPVFWRALLEVFCRAFVSSAHGSRPWPLIREVGLAIDLIEIHNNDLKGRWNTRKACAIISGKNPYKARYPRMSSRSGHRSVGEDRVDRIVEDIIGGMDTVGKNSPLQRLQSNFPDEYETVMRERERPKTAGEVQSLLNSQTYSRRDPSG